MRHCYRRIPTLFLALVIAGLVVAVWSAAAATAGGPVADVSSASVTTAFLPSKNGFSFRNPRPDPRQHSVQRALSGRCGGMAFGALDYYWAGVEPPSDASDEYLFERSAQSILGNGARFAAWTVMSDVSATAAVGGVGQLTRAEELPRLTKALEGGPVPLGLVRARSLVALGRNHQVVAYGIERQGDLALVRIYDSCQPGRDDVRLVVDLASPQASIREVVGEWEVANWRGFFVEAYDPARPPVR